MTDRRDYVKAEKAKAFAEQELIDADAWAQKALPKAKKMARKLRRIAKRLHSKAERRRAKIDCSEGY